MEPCKSSQMWIQIHLLYTLPLQPFWSEVQPPDRNHTFQAALPTVSEYRKIPVLQPVLLRFRSFLVDCGRQSDYHHNEPTS